MTYDVRTHHLRSKRAMNRILFAFASLLISLQCLASAEITPEPQPWADFKLAVDYMITAAMKPEKHKVVAPPGPMVGQKVYAANCSTCHNAGTDNAPKLGDKTAWAPIEQRGFLNIYRDIVTGQKGHPVHGGCPHCSDEELIAALKYILQQGATKNNYLLW